MSSPAPWTEKTLLAKSATERRVDVEMIGDVSDHLMMDPHQIR